MRLSPQTRKTKGATTKGTTQEARDTRNELSKGKALPPRRNPDRNRLAAGSAVGTDEEAEFYPDEEASTPGGALTPSQEGAPPAKCQKHMKDPKPEKTKKIGRIKKETLNPMRRRNPPSEKRKPKNEYSNRPQRSRRMGRGSGPKSSTLRRVERTSERSGGQRTRGSSREGKRDL